MESLSAWFEKKIFGSGNSTGQAGPVTIIGSGGKTSLIWHLARCFASKPRAVLITPTAKMFPPTESLPGITVRGSLNKKTGKLEALPPEELEKLPAAYDIVLIEGDGSRTLPLKGWAEHEPVIPSFTAITVGILPLWPLGQPVSEKIIHRLPEFCALTGAVPGEKLETEHLVKVIAGNNKEKSIFTASVGKKILFVNQIEDEKSLSQAEKLFSLLPSNFRKTVDAIIAGSVRQDRLRIIEQK
jgi:probable selenium-dependent hydroxylase accessory protein YqeC